MDIERARAEVIKLLTSPHVLYNLTHEDLGLATTVSVVAECAEKRVDLGEDEDTAFGVALDMFEAYLEGGSATTMDEFKAVRKVGFPWFMADTCLPLIKLPNGTAICNPEAVCLLPPGGPKEG